jgi:hypothetical protein
MSNDIEIIIPQKIPESIKSINGLSDVMKLQIAKRVSEGIIKIQSVTDQRIIGMNEKCELIIEILIDRAQFDKYMTIAEIFEILGGEEKYIPSFIQRLIRIAKEKSIKIKKIKRDGQSCYKVVD